MPGLGPVCSLERQVAQGDANTESRFTSMDSSGD